MRSCDLLRFFIFKLLERGHGVTRLVHAVQAAVDGAQLIPGLLDDFRICVGLDCALEDGSAAAASLPSSISARPRL